MALNPTPEPASNPKAEAAPEPTIGNSKRLYFGKKGSNLLFFS